jgi:hypothetical protein
MRCIILGLPASSDCRWFSDGRRRPFAFHDYTPEQSARLRESCWRTDLRNALRHLDRVEDSIADAKRAAEQFLADNWHAVERVASALAERGALTGAEIDGEMSGAAEHPPFRGTKRYGIGRDCRFTPP